ncbi:MULTISPECIES: hypothetical protein [Brucella/Ochrobactrum group]|uniref:Uncharacterized protein n=1 Tax=Ochrobactrum teleogrylli TaxID=2479765 RepID=A0ABD5JZJ0_9HYPH|nr:MULTISPECIES: hypothetical protein [Brucella]MDX4074755.1 hypothetical protein [Brucella sp. NBRC 113783]
MVLAFGIDKLDPGNPDVTVGARSVFLDRRRSERSANGRYLLIVNVHTARTFVAHTTYPRSNRS